MYKELRLRWVLIIACVTLAVFFGIACALDSDGDIGVSPCLAQGISCSPDEFSTALSASDTPRSSSESSARPGLDVPGLLAAARGGLRLLS